MLPVGITSVVVVNCVKTREADAGFLTTKISLLPSALPPPMLPERAFETKATSEPSSLMIGS